MPLTVVRRKQTGALTISGSIRLKDGSKIRVQRRSASNNYALAQEEAAALEADVLRNSWGTEIATPEFVAGQLVTLRDELISTDNLIREVRSEMRENMQIIKDWMARYERVVGEQTAKVSKSTAASVPPSRSQAGASLAENLLREARQRRAPRTVRGNL